MLSRQSGKLVQPRDTLLGVGLPLAPELELVAAWRPNPLFKRAHAANTGIESLEAGQVLPGPSEEVPGHLAEEVIYGQHGVLLLLLCDLR